MTVGRPVVALALAAALALAGAGATGCGEGRTACTLIGCGPSLQVDSTNLPPNQTVEVCVGASCVLADPVQGRSFGEVALDAAVADVRVVVREDGAIVSEQRCAVRVSELQPNGPKCDPTCGQVVVQVGPGGFR